MKPQIINKEGKPEYAVIPYSDYLVLIENAEMLADIRDYDSARKALASGEEELIPAAVVDRLLDGDNPVRVWREFRALSAGELANACGVTVSAISQIESGKRRPSVALLKKIGRTLNVDLDTLSGTNESSLKNHNKLISLI